MSFNINSIGQAAVDVISSVFDGNGAASFKMGNHSYGFAAVATEREKERIEFIIIGFDASSGGSLLENPVVSEIVLTRGWTETKGAKSLGAGAAGNVPVRADFPTAVYKKMTDLKPAAELQKVEVELVSAEQIKERADKLVERFVNQKR